MKQRTSHPNRVPALQAEHFLTGMSYIWIREGKLHVVTINKERDGLQLQDGSKDEFYFSHNLVGRAIGPINIYPV